MHTAEAKVREPRLLRPRLNAGTVCDESAAEASICASAAL